MALKYKKSAVLIAIISMVAITFLHYFGFTKQAEKTVATVISPIQKIFYISGNLLKRNLFFNHDLNSLNDEYKILQGKYLAVIQENNDLKSLKEENARFREILDFKERHDYTIKLTDVLGKTSAMGFEQIIINCGSDDGIIVGLPVISHGGILIGTVSKVQYKNSFVQLLTHSSSKISAKINNETNTSGLVESEFGISLKMNYVLQNMEISENDIVSTSGVDNMIPANLPIGKIQKTYKEPNNLFINADIMPLVKYDELLVVGVIVP